jgi:hypothetical protein
MNNKIMEAYREVTEMEEKGGNLLAAAATTNPG